MHKGVFYSIRRIYNYYGNEDLYMKNDVVGVNMCHNHYIPCCRSMIP